MVIRAGAAGSRATIKTNDYTKDIERPLGKYIIAWYEEDNRPYIKYPDECQLCFICQVECPAKAIKVKIILAFW